MTVRHPLWTRLMPRFGDDVDLLQEMVGLFIKELPVLLASLAAAMNAVDREAIRQHAHTLQGCIGNFHAPQLLDLCTTLEREGQHLTQEQLSIIWVQLQNEAKHQLEIYQNLYNEIQTTLNPG